MKLLVTGGMGFMGSNFIRYIYNKYPSDTLINFDALTYAGNPENLADIDMSESEHDERLRRYFFIHGDIADERSVVSAVEAHQPDVIVNFAAESHVDRSIVDSGAFVRSNIVGVHYLLEVARKNNIKFLQVSTDEIYGDIPSGYSTEESAPRPSSPYAASKTAADLLVQSYWRTHKTPVLTVRGSNNYGPYQYPEKLIPLAITNILEDKIVPIHGSGDYVRTWIHVTDFVEGVDRVLRDAALGSIYNISGNEKTNLDVLRHVAGYFGRNPEELLVHVGNRLGQDRRYAPHAGKIRQELGWKPRRHIEEALPDLVDWYRANEKWWRALKEKQEYVEHYEKQRQAKYY